MKSLPKSKMIVSLLLIGLAAIIVGGATMAWFTAEAEVADATFTAGTVVVNAEGPDGNYDLENRNLNVNPGDCGVITWNIINEGSKAARLRVNLNDVWSNVVGGEDTPDPFYFLQPDNSDWVMYDDGTDLWLYYKNDVPGTFNAADPANPNPKSSVELKLVYAFDGATMDNDYQSADLALGGSVNAIQASNDASLTDASWAAGWAAITGGAQLTGEALLNYNYFHTGAGTESLCWIANNEDDEDEIVVKDFKIKDIGASTNWDSTGTIVNGTIYDLIDQNDQPISGSQSAKVKATVKAIIGGTDSATEIIDITFDSNGVGTFQIPVGGVWTDNDKGASVEITIGDVTRTAKGD